MTFNEIYHRLRLEGYKKFERLYFRYQYVDQASYSWAVYKDKRIKIVLDDSNQGIYADAATHWDKYSSCPVRLSYPKNEYEMQYLLECFLWLRTKEAHEISNCYLVDRWRTSYVLKFTTLNDINLDRVK